MVETEQDFSGHVWRACGRCGELHSRGKGYSYCRQCAADYQREHRATKGNHSKRIAELERCIEQLSARIHALEVRSAVIGGRS